MKIHHALVAAIFAPILVISAFSTEARAWSKFGHVLVCEIAYRIMYEESREKLNALIDNQEFRDEHGEKKYPSFNHGCLREDQVRNRSSEHYVNYPRDLETVTDDECPNINDNKCVISAIQDDKEIIGNTSRSNDERLAALLALGHWVGDIHQPLHVSFGDDRGGNLIKKRGRCKKGNLHGVWDQCIVERRVIFVREPANADDYAEFTPMYRAADWMISEVTAEQEAEWIASDPWQWASESFDLVRTPELGYCVTKNDGCWYSDGLKEYDGDQQNRRTIVMDEAYLDKFGPTVILRLKQAGYRLAATIDEAFSD